MNLMGMLPLKQLRGQHAAAWGDPRRGVTARWLQVARLISHERRLAYPHGWPRLTKLIESS
jgi:hypothetical protein